MKIMMGDWVRFTENYPFKELRGTFAKITSVRQVYVGVMDINGNSYEVSSSMVEPIPLTDEILAKNFAKNGCKYFDEGQDFCIEAYFGDVSEKYQKYVILYTDLSKIFIKKELQELQHALTLIGINKEIQP